MRVSDLIARSTVFTLALGTHPTFANFEFSMEDVYTPSYCHELEAAYGEGMMSEGGAEGIESMFSGIDLHNKKALDIGSGLGGVAKYLAQTYNTSVTGIDVNSWMIDESIRRTPPSLQEHVRFLKIESNSNWDFEDKSFDIIYSKGVFTHISNKDQTLQESKRLLKEGAPFVFTDWLSSEDKHWGPNIQRLVELERLELHPESESSYIKILESNGFRVESIRDEASDYRKYYTQIIANLKSLQKSSNAAFIPFDIAASVEGYEAILRAIEEGELRVLRFVAF